MTRVTEDMKCLRSGDIANWCDVVPKQLPLDKLVIGDVDGGAEDEALLSARSRGGCWHAKAIWRAARVKAHGKPTAESHMTGTNCCLACAANIDSVDLDDP